MKTLPRGSGFLAVPFLLLAGAACRALRPPAPTSRGAPDRPQIVAREPAAVLPQDPLETIARYEEARTDGDGLLELLLARGEDKTRVRAAVALGRLPFPERGAEVTQALITALEDEDAPVRAAAAFALGLRGDPAATPALLARWKDSDAEVRARIVEAASRIDDQRLAREVLFALDDRSPLVRAEAALAPHRWTGERANAGGGEGVVDTALVTLVRRSQQADSAVHEPVEVLRAALFALARRKSSRAREVFQEHLAHADAHVRIYACQGLAGLTDPGSLDGLRTVLAGREQGSSGDFASSATVDWRIACEAAIALGKHPQEGSLAALAAGLGHPSAHVRRVVCEALGSFRDHPSEVRPLLERAAGDLSANVRAASLVALARIDGDAAAEVLTRALGDEDALLRAGAAQALAHLSDERAVPALLASTKDSNLRVAGIAIESLASHAGTSAVARARLVELLADPDNGLRLAAVTGLRPLARAEDLAPLAACFASARGEIADELAFTVLDCAAAVGGDGALSLLKQGLEHSNPYVRRKARAAIAAKFPATELPTALARNGATVKPATGRAAPAASTTPPANGVRSKRAWRENPIAEIVTNRGTMVFELLPEEAPLHVENFLELAARDFYDGLGFHRVVPDFVIQGGDPRGDGNGGSAWRSGSVPAEFTPRKFARGALGMPRNEDPDSGGAQVFVTHRETPHLDGRYTLFGLLREGHDVLDAIEVGDTIRDVRIARVGDLR